MSSGYGLLGRAFTAVTGEHGSALAGLPSLIGGAKLDGRVDGGRIEHRQQGRAEAMSRFLIGGMSGRIGGPSGTSIVLVCEAQNLALVNCSGPHHQHDRGLG